MELPFHYLRKASLYELTSRWHGKDDLIECLNKTAIDHELNITYSDVDFMICCLTKGNTNSALSNKSDEKNDLYALICKKYSKFINPKIVDKMLKCMSQYKKPNNDWIEILQKNGYIFTKSQLKTLYELGYIILNGIKSMNLDDLKSLMKIDGFFGEIRDSLNSNNIDNVIAKLSPLIIQFKIQIDCEFLLYLIGYTQISSITLDYLLNCHNVQNILWDLINKDQKEFCADQDQDQMKFSTNNLNDVFKNVSCIKYDSPDSIQKVKSILSFYSINNAHLTRGIFLNNDLHFFELIAHPSLTDYNPINDIYYWINRWGEPSYELIEQLIMKKYIKYDQFLMNLYSLGFGGGGSIDLNKLSDMGIQPTQKQIDRMFRLGIDIESLLENRFVPTSEQLHTIMSPCAMEIINSSYYCSSLSLKLKNQMDHERNIFKAINSKYDSLEVFLSLSKRDQYIFERLSTNDWTNISTILLYDIHLTKSLLILMMYDDMWESIVKLIHISTKYDYVIDLIDNKVVECCSSYTARVWLRKNILEPKSNKLLNPSDEPLSFADPIFSHFGTFDHMIDTFSEHQMMEALSKKEIIFDHNLCLQTIKDNYIDNIKYKISQSIQKTLEKSTYSDSDSEESVEIPMRKTVKKSTYSDSDSDSEESVEIPMRKTVKKSTYSDSDSEESVEIPMRKTVKKDTKKNINKSIHRTMKK